MFKAIYVDFIISDDLHLVLRLRMIGVTPTLLRMSYRHEGVQLCPFQHNF